ncbi:MAG: hypothetical protein GXO54_05450 [Chloroflexi bacterium]|nr:hypothetical protein [Chloroflexota bacterium]
MFTLHLETDIHQQCPFWFTKTDSKLLCNYLFFEHLWQTGNDPDVIGMLKEHFGLDISPLLKVASEDLSLEDWLAEGYGDEAEWRKQMEINQAAWQPPQALIQSLRAFLQALDSEPDVFEKLGISDAYFVEGYFKQDLIDLLRMAEWAQNAGARRVRFVMG